MNIFNTAQSNYQQLMPRDGKPMTPQAYAMDVAQHYSTYSIDDKRYTLDVIELPDFIQQEFASKILSSDSMLSSEATGPDNALFEKEMLPSLLSILANSTDKDKEINFINAWRDGVTNYTKRIMQDLIDNALFAIN